MVSTKTNKLVNSVLLVVGLACIAVLGCASFVDMLTPADVSNAALEYVSQQPDGWTSLHTARDIRNKIIVKHRTEQLGLLRAAEDDKFAYADAINTININIQEAESLQTLIIGDENHPFSILGVLGGALPGLAIGGLLLKRPKDYTPEQVEVIVSRRLAHVNSTSSSPNPAV